MKGFAFALAMVAMLCMVFAVPVSAGWFDDAPDNDDFVKWVNGLRITTFAPPKGGQIDKMIVVLPGDGWGDWKRHKKVRSNYIVPVAQGFSGPGVLAIAMCRPGNYMGGERSAGHISFEIGAGTLYKESTIKVIEEAIRRLKNHYQPKEVILYGHSGGGAISLVILGKDPGLVDRVCGLGSTGNVAQWRKEMGHSRWSVLNGEDYLPTVPKTAKILLLSGDKDKTVPAKFLTDYAEKAKAAGLSVEFHVVTGGHGIANKEPAMSIFAEWAGLSPKTIAALKTIKMEPAAKN